MEKIKFSLVMATLGRDTDVEIFCESLSSQSYRNFELIIVDQNADNRLEKIAKKYSEKFPLIHVRSAQIGLSKNRNIGLRYVSGDVVAFPDDDCEYKNDTLKFVAEKISDFDFVTFNSRDKILCSRTYSYLRDEKIKIKNLLRNGISYTIFARKNCMENFSFDENLGCGAEFGSGEETDLMLFLLSKNFRGFYFGTYTIFHPYKPMSNDDAKRALSYAKGYGAIFYKAIFFYGRKFLFFKFAFALFKNFCGIFLLKKSRYHFIALKGKLYGFINYNGGKNDKRHF